MSSNDNYIPIPLQIRQYLKAVRAHAQLSQQLVAFLKSI